MANREKKPSKGSRFKFIIALYSAAAVMCSTAYAGGSLFIYSNTLKEATRDAAINAAKTLPLLHASEQEIIAARESQLGCNIAGDLGKSVSTHLDEAKLGAHVIDNQTSVRITITMTWVPFAAKLVGWRGLEMHSVAVAQLAGEGKIRFAEVSDIPPAPVKSEAAAVMECGV